MAAVAKAEQLVLGLGAAEPATRLAALRSIKNCVIGNKRQKLQYIRLGAVQLLVGLLASPAADAPALVQAAAALGSFAASEEGLQVVLQHGGVPHLLRVLQSSQDEKVVEAAARALKAVCRSPAAPTHDILASEGVPQRLVALLGCSTSNVAESAAVVLGCCCQGAQQQAAVATAGAVAPLVSLLSSPQRSKQEAALEALAALSRGNAETSAAMLQHGSVVSSLLRAIKQGGTPHMRFVAAVCLANLSRNLPAGHEEHSQQDLQQAVLPVLVRLLGEAGVQEDVPGALCQLVEGSPELQQAAADADAIAKLAAILREPARPPRLVEGVLRCLATLCATREEHRRKLVEAKVLAQIAAALSDPLPATRAAACMCMRSLSRSTKLLRGHLGDVELASPLLALAAEPDVEVAAQAVGTLANMAVDFSAVKDQLLRAQGVARFAALAESMQPALRLHGVWGLSSVAYMATQEVKASIVQQLAWSSVAALLEDPEPDVREKVVLLLRNMVYNSHADIQAVLAWSSHALLAAVRDALQRSQDQAGLKQHAMYVVVNMASSTAAHKAAVMSSGWPELLVQQLSDRDERVREAAVWAIINLTWSQEGDAEETAARVQQLRMLGVEDQLRSLEHDECLSVKERARTALDQLQLLAAVDHAMQARQEAEEAGCWRCLGSNPAMRSKRGKDAVLPMAPAFSFGAKHTERVPDGPGPGAFSPPSVPPKGPSSPAFTFRGVDDVSTLRRAAEVPGPAMYCPERADSITKPLARAPSMHARPSSASYLPKEAAGLPAPNAYSPQRPGSATAPGYSFSRRGHNLGAPAAAFTLPGPGQYSLRPGVVSKAGRGSASFTFGQRPRMRDPLAGLPGPGAYEFE